MATKHFILSTRTLVSKRDVTQSFGSDNIIYVPMAVMEEIEAKYYDCFDERGKIARENLAYLGKFHIKDLQNGVTQENGSILKVTTNYNDVVLSEAIKETECSKLDKRILQTCLGIKAEVPEGEPVVLVSKRETLRKKAEMIGVNAQTFRDELLPEISEQYKGRTTLEVKADKFEEFEEKCEIPLKDVVSKEDLKNFYPNMFIKLKCGYREAYGRVCQNKNKILALAFERHYPYRVIPKNDGQHFIIEALMMDARIAQLVIIKGIAGTGKTYLTMAAGIEHIMEHGRFTKKILISRSPTEVGEKLGHLPGDEGEKMSPYVRGIKDALENLLGYTPNMQKEQPKKGQRRNFHHDEEYDKPENEDGTIFFENGLIKVEAIGFIRGRTITDTYIVIDEVQNLTPLEVKTIVTRVGEGSKLILLGDPTQVDRPGLDERNNGLSYVSERMKGEALCWQITMSDDESVRSELAKRASMLL